MIRVRYNLRTLALVIGSICVAFAAARFIMQQATTIYVHPIPPGCRVFLGNRELPGGRLNADEAIRLGLPITVKDEIRHEHYRTSPLGIYLLDAKGARASAGFLHLRPAPGTTKNIKTVSISIDGIPADVIVLNHASFYENGKVGFVPCPVFGSNPSARSVRLMGTVDRDARRTFTLEIKVPKDIQREANALHGGVQMVVIAASLTDLAQTDRSWDLQSADTTIDFELPLRMPDEQFVLAFRFRGSDGKEIKSLLPFSQEVSVVE
jgi:hypothetical protein